MNYLSSYVLPLSLVSLSDYLNKSLLFKGDNVSQRWCLMVECISQRDMLKY